MTTKRSLFGVLAIVCCLPIMAAAAQDATAVVPPVATLVQPVATLVEPALTAVPGSDATTTAPSGTGSIGSTDTQQMATSEPGMMATPMMGTMEPAMMSTSMMGTMEPSMMESMMMTPTDPNARTIGDILVFQAGLSTPEFTMLRQALQDTGLLETLMDPKANYVLFAPTDAALSALPKDVLNAVMSDPNQLRALLLNHVASGDMFMNSGMDMMGTMEPSMMTQDMMGTMEPSMMMTQDMMMGTMEPGMMATDDMMMGTMEPGMMATDDMMENGMMGRCMMGTMEPGMMATQDMMMGTMEPAMMATEDMMENEMMHDKMDVVSLGGLTLMLEDYDNCLTVNGIEVLGEITASNGHIFVINGVLTPDMMATMEPAMMATQDMMMGTMEPAMMATMEATKQP